MQTIGANTLIQLLRESQSNNKTVWLYEHEVTGGLSFTQESLPVDVHFVRCTFTGEVDFSLTTFKRTVDISECLFKKRTRFRASHFDADLLLNRSTFEDGFDLTDATIGLQLQARGAQLTNSSFNRTVLLSEADFRDTGGVTTTFSETTNFELARFAGDARFHGAQFDGPATFTHTRFEARAGFGLGVNEAPTTFSDNVDFLAATFNGPASFYATQFTGVDQLAIFRRASFGDDADFTGAFFGSGANFDSCQCEGLFVFRPYVKPDHEKQRATFRGDAIFINIGAGDLLDLSDAEFTELADFRHARIKGECRFSRTIFWKVCDFNHAKIDGLARFDGAEFGRGFVQTTAPTTANAFFGSVQFGGDVKFERALFGYGQPVASGQPSARRQSSVDFIAANFASDAVFDGAQFEEGAQFDSIHIRGRALFRPASALGPCRDGEAPALLPVRFAGEAWFTGADIEALAFFPDVAFLGNADFSLVRFRGPTTFSSARFSGDAEFSQCTFGGRARFRFVEFDQQPNNKDETTSRPSFIGASFAGDADFQGARFAQGAMFDSARFDGRAFFRPIAKDKTERAVQFGGTASFISAQVKNQAEFESAEFNDHADFAFVVFASSALFTDARFQTASFGGAHFNQRASFANVKFKAAVRFTGAEFNADLRFEGAKFESDVGFLETTARSVFFREALIAKRPAREEKQFVGNTDLRGFTYTRLYVAWHDLLDSYRDWVNCQRQSGTQNAHERQPYAQLESSLRTMGRDREADDVYYVMRRHEGRRLWFLRPVRTLPLRFMAALWDTIEWGFARYGVRPMRLAVAALVLILLGANIFIYPNAVVKKQPTTSIGFQAIATDGAATPAPQTDAVHLDTWDAIGVSLSQFLPVDAAWGGDVKPARTTVPMFHDVQILSALDLRVDAQMYGAVHRAIGWLVIPVGIAAIAGWLRRQVKR